MRSVPKPRDANTDKRTLTPALRGEILAIVPRLRAFAVSLTASTDRADDLVQETMLRALTHIGQFQPGTNLRAWLFTILRNQFNSEYRQRRWTAEDADGIYVDSLKTMPQQSSWLEFQELRIALTKLPPEQRKPPISAAAPSAPSRAASIAVAPGWPSCWRSKPSTTWGRTRQAAP
jgi:RNA polymerase sigma-70 factor, ECF subfamily